VSAKKAVLVMVVIALIAAYGLLILNSPDDSPQQRPAAGAAFMSDRP